MPLDADDLLKIQQMINTTIPRQEYESRHQDLEKQVLGLSAQIQNTLVLGRAERDKIMDKLDTNSELFKSEVHEVGTQLNGLKDDIAASHNNTLRYIVTVIVSFVIGVCMLFLTLIVTHVHF